MTDWLLGTLLATSALVLFVLVIREPVRRRFGSRVTYGLWLIPAARLFMPTLTHTVERTVPSGVALQPLSDPLVRESLWMARVAPPEPTLIDRLGGWPNILLALWLAVALGLFVSRLVAYFRDRRAILGSSVEIDRIGSVRVVGSSEVASPVALGIVDRLIAVPAEFDRLYGARERRLVIEHELAHHRSGDLIANLFAFVLLCLQWFNPLAWFAHAAFRFDQEAACDARVLDKAGAADRADYGRAIAKAASGRALLFASALDRRNTLHRRLQSMLRNSSPTRRIAGRLLVITAIAAALPLTATRAVRYVDVPTSTPLVSAHINPVAAPSRVAARIIQAGAPLHEAIAAPRVGPPPASLLVEAAVAPAPAAVAVPISAAAVTAAPATRVYGYDNLTINGDFVTIDGVTKRFEDLTPAEKARVRAEVAKARASLQNVHIDSDRIARAVAAVPDERRMAQLQRQLARAQARGAESAEAMRRSFAAVDWPRVAQSFDDARRSFAAGDWQRVNQSVANARRAVAAVDWQRVNQSIANAKRAVGAVNWQDVAHAQQSVDSAKIELDRIQARLDAHPNQ
jgi:bla regulator protein BlaR1